MSTVDLLYEYEKGERVWYDEVRDPQSLMGHISKYLKVDPEAPTNNENRIFTRILRFFEHFSEIIRTHTFSSLIE
jgi:hypothetical protein